MVKCKDCAFLTLKNQYLTEFLEVGPDYRTDLTARGNLSEAAKDGPLCFMLAADFGAEILADLTVPDPARTLAVLGKDRDCPKFTAWARGYNPKEMAERMHNSEIVRIAEARLVADEERAEVRRRADIDRAEVARRADLKYRVLIPVFTAVVTFVFTYLVPKLYAYLSL